VAEIVLPGGRKIGVGRPRCPKCNARGVDSGMDAWGCVRCNWAKHIQNPAWDYIANTVPHDDLFASIRPQDGQFRPSSYGNLLSGGPAIPYRSRVTTRWTWAIPDPDTLQFIFETLDGRPVVEIGAGNGYWAWLFAQMGVEVLAYDKSPVGTEDSWYSAEKIQQMGSDWRSIEPEEFYPVQQGGPEVLSEIDSEHVLFLSWPPYSGSMAYDAVKAFKGDTVIYIGEGNGGCTADWRFFALMEGSEDPWGKPEDEADVPAQEWEEVTYHPIVQWGGINDYVTVYTRKS
jgi:hypothetical protein